MVRSPLKITHFTNPLDEAFYSSNGGVVARHSVELFIILEVATKLSKRFTTYEVICWEQLNQ